MEVTNKCEICNASSNKPKTKYPAHQFRGCRKNQTLEHQSSKQFRGCRPIPAQSNPLHHPTTELPEQQRKNQNLAASVTTHAQFISPTNHQHRAQGLKPTELSRQPSLDLLHLPLHAHNSLAAAHAYLDYNNQPLAADATSIKPSPFNSKAERDERHSYNNTRRWKEKHNKR